MDVMPALSTINIFPNPTSGHINIRGLNQAANVSICNTQGKLLKSYEEVNNSIDISDLKPGIYILVLKAEGQSLVRKIVKE